MNKPKLILALTRHLGFQRMSFRLILLLAFFTFVCLTSFHYGFYNLTFASTVIMVIIVWLLKGLFKTVLAVEDFYQDLKRMKEKYEQGRTPHEKLLYRSV